MANCDINQNEYDSILENKGINIKNESTFHSDIKKWYYQDGDRLEVKIDGSIIDMVRGELLIEIQTCNFYAICSKLKKLISNHKVRIIFPVCVNKWIVYIDKNDGSVLKRRKSTRKGTVYDFFNELIAVTKIIDNPNISFEILFADVEETRCNDGFGSYRRNGISIIDKKLLRVNNSSIINNKDEFKALLPKDIPQKFTNKEFALIAKIPVNIARKTTYCFRKMGIICECGKYQRSKIFTFKNL